MRHRPEDGGTPARPAGKQPLKVDAVTCGAPDCQRARERRLLRERYGPGTRYAAAPAPVAFEVTTRERGDCGPR